MSRKTTVRVVIAIAAIVALVWAGLDFMNRDIETVAPDDETIAPAGTITLVMDGDIITDFTPSNVQDLEIYSFEDIEEAKLQSGALLRDVILLFVDEADLSDESQITVSSSARNKSVTLTWAQVNNPDNLVLFDPSSNRGTLKLVSMLEILDTREEWIQDTDRIEITSP